MTFKGFRLTTVALSAVLTLGLLMGATYAAQLATVHRPLARVLEERPEVQWYQIVRRSGGTTITVQLGATSDLAAVYRELQADVRRVSGGDSVRLVISDRRNDQLAAVYHELHFAIQEALANGSYSRLAEAAQALATQAGLENHRITVDNDYVYVQLHRGEHYLYEVIERRPGGAGS